MGDARTGLGAAPVAMVVAAVSAVQVGAALGATLFDDVGPFGAVWLRIAFAAVVLAAVWRPRWRGLTAADARLAVLFGLAMAGMNACIYAAMDRIPLGIAVTIEFAGPLAVAVAGSRRALDLAWVVLAGGGIALLGGGGSGLDPIGVAFAVAAGALWAAYIVLSARVGRAFPGGAGLALAMVVGAVAVAPLGVAGGGSGLLGAEVLAVGLGVALMSSVIPYSLELEALRRMPAGVFGVLMSLEPAVAAVAGLVVLGQVLAVAEWLGIALVVVASAGAALGARTPLADPP